MKNKEAFEKRLSELKKELKDNPNMDICINAGVFGKDGSLVKEGRKDEHGNALLALFPKKQTQKKNKDGKAYNSLKRFGWHRYEKSETPKSAKPAESKK